MLSKDAQELHALLLEAELMLPIAGINENFEEGKGDAIARHIRTPLPDNTKAEEIRLAGMWADKMVSRERILTKSCCFTTAEALLLGLCMVEELICQGLLHIFTITTISPDYRLALRIHIPQH